MNKYKSLTPADRILSYLEKEDQEIERVLPLDPETEALLSISSEELEAEALLIDPDHVAHLENLRAMIGLAPEDRGDDAVQPHSGTDGRDDGTEPANCNLPATPEHRSASRMGVGSLLVPHDRRRSAGTAAYGRSIARGGRHLVRSERKGNDKHPALCAVLRFSFGLVIVGMLTSSFALDYQQIQNEGERNKDIHNRLTELSSKVNVLTSALKASEDGVQRTEILHSETDKRAYYLGLANWMFDPSASSINAVASFNCSAYCKKKEWSVTREKSIFKTASYGSSRSTENVYALRE